jgi:hypothetical protein
MPANGGLSAIGYLRAASLVAGDAEFANSLWWPLLVDV